MSSRGAPSATVPPELTDLGMSSMCSRTYAECNLSASWHWSSSKFASAGGRSMRRSASVIR